MATIGTFHKQADGSYSGAIKTLSLNVKTAQFRASDKDNDKAPDFRIFAGKVQVAVDVASVVRASPSSFRVEWVERRYQDGVLSSTERWSAILTIVLQSPRTAEDLRKNPLGVFVHALNWSREMA